MTIVNVLPEDRRERADPVDGWSRTDLAWTLGVVTVLTAAGVVARWWSRPALWLDEAQSIHIASQPIGSIPDALREDGAPPLFYVLLHVWMELFGDGDRAVRTLSTLCSLAALIGIPFVARRFGGERTALFALAVFATNPFVIRYATETRMYALVMALVVAGVVAVAWCLERATPVRVAAVAVVAAALLYTHYWSLYLVAALALTLAVVARRSRAARWTLAGLAAGAVLWLPWLPVMRHQAAHTATPWAAPASLQSLAAPVDVGGRASGWLMFLHGALVSILLIVAVVRRRPGRDGPVRFTVAVVVTTLALALIGSVLSSSAYVPRYTSVITPLVVLLVAAGAGRLRAPTGLAMVGALGAVGLAMAVDEFDRPRTRSDELMALVAAQAARGDHVVYCPDQLGPAATRVLAQRGDPGVEQSVYPAGPPPTGVDWTDYEDRHKSARPGPFVDALLHLAGDRDVWLIWSGSYPPTQPACRGLLQTLERRRPDHEQLIADDRSVPDHGGLWVFRAGP